MRLVPSKVSARPNHGRTATRPILPRAVFVDCTKLTIFVRWDNRISRKMKLSCGAREPSELYAPQARTMLQIFFLIALIGGSGTEVVRTTSSTMPPAQPCANAEERTRTSTPLTGTRS